MDHQQDIAVQFHRDHFKLDAAVVRADVLPPLLAASRYYFFWLLCGHDVADVGTTQPVLPAGGRELDPHSAILSNRTSFVKRKE